jgi:hypothetical protein
LSSFPIGLPRAATNIASAGTAALFASERIVLEICALPPGQRLQKMHLPMSTFAVEKSFVTCHKRRGAKLLPATKEVEMRIVETAAAGVIAIASQILIVAAVLL